MRIKLLSDTKKAFFTNYQSKKGENNMWFLFLQIITNYSF